MTESYLRELTVQDRGLHEAHLLRLSTDERVLRFAAATSDQFISAYCADMRWPHRQVHGYFADGILRAVAELVIELPTGGELALSCERGCAGDLARRDLLNAALASAGAIGILRICMQVLSDEEWYSLIGPEHAVHWEPQTDSLVISISAEAGRYVQEDTSVVSA